MRVLMAAAALFLVAGAAGCATLNGGADGLAGDPTFEAAPFRAHVAFLADDLLEGRETGSRGHAIAAHYVAAEFEALGLTPAGDDGSYFQAAPLRSYTASPDTDRVTFSRNDGARPSLTPLEDYIVDASPSETSAHVRAPVVYVGFGVVDETYGRDDYAGLDVAGKIVAILQGVPDGFPSEVGAYHRSSRRKAAVADAHGAAGVLWLPTPQSVERVAWERYVARAGRASMDWVGEDGRVSRRREHVRVTATLSEEGARKLFEGASLDKDALFAALADADAPTPAGFALPVEAEITATSTHVAIASMNVAGVLEGADAALRGEYVVLSAHLDHLGTFERPDTDDRIHNGALDNASGVAAMLEVARAFAEKGRRPRRSLLFLAVTAEEKGLVGSDYYAAHPTRPIDALVADVNLDMPLLLYDFTDVIAFGAERSNVGATAAAAMAPLGVSLAPDPMPEEAVFVRSDHFNFVRRGVPAVFLATGYANGGEEAWSAFFAERYHRPGDDIDQGIDWEAGAKFAHANFRIVRALADADARPKWKAGDYFGLLFDGPMLDESAP